MEDAVWLAEIAEGVRNSVDEISLSVSESLVARKLVPYSVGILELESIRANLLGIVDTFELGEPAGSPTAALKVAWRGASERLSDRSLTLIYFVGLSVIWADHIQWRVVATSRSIAEGATRCEIAFRLLSRYLESVEHDVAERLRAERKFAGPPLTREEQIVSVLGGSDQRDSIGAYRLSVAHVSIIGWTDAKAVERPVDAVVKHIVESIPTNQHLLYRPDRDRLVIWISSETRAKASSMAVELLSSIEGRGVINYSIGEPAQGIDGFRTSFEEAEYVRQFLLGKDLNPGYGLRHSFRDVALTSILLKDEVLAKRFVAAQLGELAGAAHSALRETLLIYFREDFHLNRTAARLGIHRNTVAQRLVKANTLLSVGVDSRSLEFGVALLVASYLHT